MVAYSFQKRFEPAIVADVKLFTIRAPRKRHARFGEELQLYTGMRTRHCRLIGRRRARSPHNVVIDVSDQDMRAFWIETHSACGAEEDKTAFHGVIVQWFPSVIGADPVSPIERELDELGL